MRKFVSVLIMTTMLFCSCAHWTDADRLAFGFACVGQGADLWTTDRNFQHGAHEQILPWDDTGSQTIFRAGLISITILLGEAVPEKRRFFFGILGFVGTIAAFANQISYDNRP